MAGSADLGPEAEVVLPQGTVRYRARGHGAPVVFVHGLLVNGDLWHEVVPGVAEAGYRCLTPDLPLGSHTMPLSAGADTSPPAVAQLLDDFLVALDLDDVTIVANDTGGAIVQILMARRPPRVARVVLTSCDSLERFFPPMFRFLPLLARMPGGTWLIAHLSAVRALQRMPLTFGWLTKRAIPPKLARSFGEPAKKSRAVRRDMRGFVRAVHPRHTLAAAEHFGEFDRPVLLAWARQDKLFPVSLAERIAKLLPDVRLEMIDDAYTFLPLDQPEALTLLITDFLMARTEGDGQTARRTPKV
jgi:pimeloyl-ACP methyl ester carboxylesterase